MQTAAEFPFDNARSRVYRWAYRLLHNDQDALDATQTVLMKALHGSPGRPGQHDAWLRRVTINHCLDVLRRKREVSALPIVPSPACEPGATLEDAERRDRIAEALQRLTEVQRLVLLAKTYDEETFEAIARSMNISASSVKTHYVRAVSKMRDLLADYVGAKR